MAAEFRAYIGERALAIDLINIAPLDDLHNPYGIIREAQALAAEAFGADHSSSACRAPAGRSSR